MSGVGGIGGSGGMNPLANLPGDSMSPQDQAAVKEFMSQMSNLSDGGISQIIEGKPGYFGAQSPGQLVDNMNKALSDINSTMKSFTELTGWNGSVSSPTFSRENEYPTSSPMYKFINQIIGDCGVGQSDGPLGGFLSAKSAIEGWMPTLKAEPSGGPPFYSLDPTNAGNGSSPEHPLALMGSPDQQKGQKGNSLSNILGNASMCGSQLSYGIESAAAQFFPADFPKG